MMSTAHTDTTRWHPKTLLTWAVGVVVLMAIAGCSQQVKLLPKQTMPAKVDHWVTTDDNWTLHVQRYKPTKVSATKSPVILCHGLSHNNVYWDLAPSVSLARFLQEQGYDVWNVSLRGAGQSTKPKLSQLRQLFRLNLSVFNPEGLAHRQPALIRMNWNVDDHIQHDVPTVIDYVRQRTGHKQVHWIGHSMGSMIMFAYLATADQSKINSFVGISAPMYLIRPANDVYELMADQADFVRIGNIAAGTNLRAVFGTIGGALTNSPIDLLFMNDANVEPALLHAFFYACEEDISPGQLDQLIQYLKNGHFVSSDGKTDYTALVEKIRVPVAQVVGQLDNMISPGCAAVIHKRLGSTDKAFRVIGRINGHRADYGHDDIIIGRHSKTDVFPYITDWLDKHPATQPTTQPTAKPKRKLLNLPDLRKLLPGGK